MSHYPVMLSEVLESLAPTQGGVYVDGTFGAGGYTRAILQAADCHVFAIDRDPSARAAAQDVGESYGLRFHFLQGNFSEMVRLLSAAGVTQVDGIVLDVGVSSMQIDDAGRGFSFQKDGPLDMRMSADGESAADIVNGRAESDLANIIYKYGEERRSRRVAKAIVMRRKEKRFETTLDLAQVIAGALPRSGGDKINPATRTFQALRIAVNDELSALEGGLQASLGLLKPGGRLVVVSFHSLEDRLVKSFMREYANDMPKGSRHMPERSLNASLLQMETRGALKPSEREVAENARSRSARLRMAVRTEVPV